MIDSLYLLIIGDNCIVLSTMRNGWLRPSQTSLETHVQSMDCLQGLVFVNPYHMQSLQMKSTLSMTMNEWFPWNPNVLQVLNYSLIHGSVPLCIASVSWAVSHGCSVFGCWRLERLHPNMPYKLTPELTINRRWTVQYCLRVPPSGTLIVPIGNPRVLCRNKAFFCVSFNHCFVVWINFDLFFSYSS